ncbi:BamA/TamA family outer membrane protein [candidate division KSB1 bacterium]|nr:BamA/TamA family outer membrane protein [candidate division KSB1 bacterium]
MKPRLVALLFASFLAHAVAQSNNPNRFETRVPGMQYQAGALHKFFFGPHHRNLWTIPIEAPILNMATFAGGLTPTKTGGGFQTKSLRFKSGDGREFAFRSLDKDPSKVLPPDLRETIAASIARDQISSAHPYSALVVPGLAEAMGVLHADPQIVIMPDDPSLGQFRNEFAGLLGFIEERPADGPNGEPGFAGSDKIVSTDDLFEELEEDNDDYVDPQAHLKARLLDILVGDWDRHADQWRWARFKREKKNVWLPIPRDRDQAFVKLDGVLPALAEKRYMIRQLENYYKKKPDIISLTHSGRHMDRRFLNRLSWEDFKAVADEVTSKVTDEVIDNAVRRLPPQIYSVNGADLTQRLKVRRAYLPKAAEQYYKHLAQYPEIVASNKDEYVEIERRDNEHMDVRIFKRDAQSGEKREDVLFSRTFNRSHTKEVRLFLLGGKDKVVLNGAAEKSILVRLIGGSGEDEIVDHAKTKTIVYDTETGNQFTQGAHTKLKTGKVDSVINLHDAKPLLRDYGYDAKPLPFFAFTPDDGVFLGTGMSYYQYSFRMKPYSYRMSFAGNFAFKTQAFRARYNAYFVDAIGPVDWSFVAQATVPREVRNFYGLGNDTPRDADLETEDFYRVRSKEYLLGAAWHLNLSQKATLAFGGAFKHFDTQFNGDSTFVFNARPYGIDTPSLFELNSELIFDLRDRPVASSKGVYFGAGFSFYPKALESDSTFSKGYVDARLYLSPAKAITLALHGWGAKAWGTFPYYEAVYVGGNRSLRGYLRERFGGDTAALGSAELRLALFRPLLLVPTEVGIFGFTDAGRVWLNEKSPEGWHTSAGGGIWFAPIARTSTVSIGAASSVEGLRITVGGGFAF